MRIRAKEMSGMDLKRPKSDSWLCFVTPPRAILFLPRFCAKIKASTIKKKGLNRPPLNQFEGETSLGRVAPVLSLPKRATAQIGFWKLIPALWWK